ncbi:16S rRNA (adenine(1518)-N(6)/adenine(1519)-N(6))-dimethyltransferaseRsmA [soil metagenome]
MTPGAAGAPPDGPAQPTLRRLHGYGIRPKHDLGQNFLIDDNLLGVIERAAELDSAADLALEVGGGLGTLSEHLAPRVRHLHVVEVDAALGPALDDALAPHRNATLHLADAVRLDLSALAPEPNKVVANLPYGVAATVLLRTIREMPAVTLWVAMVQREVADRLAAGPGSRTYGATSAIAQLSCEVRLLRRVSASVFHPRPRVESALVRLRRVAPPPRPATVALVHAAFAHRRKALAGSLALAPGAAADLRERVREELVELGHPPDARAERLSPQDFEILASRLGEASLGPVPVG